MQAVCQLSRTATIGLQDNATDITSKRVRHFFQGCRNFDWTISWELPVSLINWFYEILCTKNRILYNLKGKTPIRTGEREMPVHIAISSFQVHFFPLLCRVFKIYPSWYIIFEPRNIWKQILVDSQSCLIICTEMDSVWSSSSYLWTRNPDYVTFSFPIVGQSAIYYSSLHSKQP